MAEITDEQIAAAALAPQSASSDGQSVSAQPLSAIIEAKKQIAANTAASKPHRGLRFTKLVPPGTNP